MVQILGTGIEAEEQEVIEEARSVVGSIITQLIAIARRIIDTVLRVTRQIIAWAGEHPLAAILLTANILIWIS